MLVAGAYRRDPTDAVRLVGTVAAVLSISAGVIHISAAGDHTNLPIMFVGFMVVAVLQVGLGGLLLWQRPSRLLIAAAVALMVSSLGLWMLSRTAGLPFLPGGHLEPIGFKDGVTKLFEIGSIPALLLLASPDLAGVSLPSPRLSSQVLGVLGAGTFALFVPALLLNGGEHHTHAEAVAMGIHEHDHAEGEEGHEHGDELAHHEDSETAGHTHGEDGHQHAGGEDSAGGHSHAAGTDGHSHTDLASTLGADHHTLGAHEHSTGSPHTHTDTGDESAPHEHGGGGGGGDGHQHTDTDEGTQHTHPDGDQHTGDHNTGGSHDDGSGHDGHGDAPAEDGEEPISLTYEPAKPAQNGQPARGSAIVFRSESGPYEEGAHSGEFHHGSTAGCNPTPEEQAIADKLYADTNAELSKYVNNPAQAIADGFYQVVGPADRFVHMINIDRVFNPTILEPGQIESFMYAMTDRGLYPLGGMYILPAELKDGKVTPTEPKKGPYVAGCLTRWHKHAGWVAAASTAGTNWEETPEMLHVWTYPGLDPWSHYDGPQLSQLWAPWAGIPSFCRISPGGTNVCFP